MFVSCLAHLILLDSINLFLRGENFKLYQISKDYSFSINTEETKEPNLPELKKEEV
jgi:hypothetical protein